MLFMIVARLFDFYQILIIVWCILSWLPTPRDGVLSDVVGAIDTLVSPYINLFRRFLPPFGGIDFSPIFFDFSRKVKEKETTLPVILSGAKREQNRAERSVCRFQRAAAAQAAG